MTATAHVSEKKNPAQTRMLKFYEIGEALEIAREWLLEPDHQQALIDAEGDLDALPELRDLLEGVEIDFAVKAEHVALMVKEFDLTSKAQKAEADRLRALSKTSEASAEGLKGYLRKWLLRLNIKKIEGTRAKPRVQINNPSVTCTLDAEQLSQLHAMEIPYVQAFQADVVYQVDHDAVIAAYKAAVAAVETTLGKMPDVGETDYHPRLATWTAAVDQALRDAGVPAGISVERGYHTRIG